MCVAEPQANATSVCEFSGGLENISNTYNFIILCRDGRVCVAEPQANATSVCEFSGGLENISNTYNFIILCRDGRVVDCGGLENR